MGLFGKFGAVFGLMPPSVLWGMYCSPYSTVLITVIRMPRSCFLHAA
jgi:xanthine/uracil permease